MTRETETRIKIDIRTRRKIKADTKVTRRTHRPKKTPEKGGKLILHN